jgi:hypothetical protein
MRAGDFLQDHDVGIALGEELDHVVHAIVAAPQIEGNDAQEALASGGAFAAEPCKPESRK